jgi:hypothetical protein
MAYVNKRIGKNATERFAGLYRAVDGSYKSAGTFSTRRSAPWRLQRPLSGTRACGLPRRARPTRRP